MEQLLLDLINRFSQNIPELVTVDEDYGQLEMINRDLAERDSDSDD